MNSFYLFSCLDEQLSTGSAGWRGFDSLCNKGIFFINFWVKSVDFYRHWPPRIVESSRKKLWHSIRVCLFVSLWFENWSHGGKQTETAACLWIGAAWERHCQLCLRVSRGCSRWRCVLCFPPFFFCFWQQFSVFSLLCFASSTLCWRRWAGGSGTRSSALITCLLLIYFKRC